MPIKIEYKTEQEIRDIKVTGLVSYSDVIDETYRLLEEKNIRVKYVIYKPSSNGDTVTATFILDDGVIADPDIFMSLTWTHSYHKAIRFQCNSSATTTDGLIVVKGVQTPVTKARRSSDAIKYKDEIFSDLQLEISYILNSFNEIIKFKDTLKGSVANLEVAAISLGILYVQFNILTTSQASVIKDWLLTNTIKTGWDIYTSFAEGLRDSHPKQFMNDHIDSYLFFQDSFSEEIKPKELYLPNETPKSVNQELIDDHDFISKIPSVIFIS